MARREALKRISASGQPSSESTLRAEMEAILPTIEIDIPVEAIVEVVKYVGKVENLIENPEWFLEFTEQISGLRFIDLGGVLKDLLKEAQKEAGTDDEMLLKKKDSDDESLEEVVRTFAWRMAGFGDEFYRFRGFDKKLTKEERAEIMRAAFGGGKRRRRK